MTHQQADKMCGARHNNLCLTVFVEKEQNVPKEQLDSIQSVKGTVLHIILNTSTHIARFSLYQNSCKKININFGLLQLMPLREVWGKQVPETCFDDMKNVTFKVAHPIHIPHYKYSQLGEKISGKMSF